MLVEFEWITRLYIPENRNLRDYFYTLNARNFPRRRLWLSLYKDMLARITMGRFSAKGSLRNT
jgi:hypothetical protein